MSDSPRNDREQGCYYLHENGTLIYKPYRVQREPGGFVKSVWTLDPTDRACAWLICIEALALGANKPRVMELATKWGLTDDDAPAFAEHTKQFTLFKDGDKWCAGFADFVNIAESQCGFGTTALEALADLARPGLLERGWVDR